MRVIPLVLLFCLFPLLAFGGTTYYVDATTGSDGDAGTTMATAWATVSKVNSTSLSTGDDVYFKCGETWSGTRLDIDWEGSASDQAIIGAYYNDGGVPVYGVSGSRPVIDGNSWTTPATESGLVHSKDNTGGYITIRDLRIQDSKFQGIFVKNCGTNNVIENCYVYRSVRGGIFLGRASGSVITKNTVEYSSYPKGNNSSGGIVVSAQGALGTTDDNVVSYNTVFHTYEGINGCTQKCRRSIVEYNTVYDCRSYHIYLDAGKDTIVRYNLVYSSSVAASTWEGPEKGITIDNEQWPWCFTGGHRIYGNLVAGSSTGINLLNQYQRFVDGTCTQDDNLIYANTVVDATQYNFKIKHGPDMGGGSQSAWSGNEIWNNISWTLSGGSNHVTGCNQTGAGITWGNNLWDEDPGTGACDAGTDPANAPPQLSKTSGWQSLAAGTVVGTEFSLQPDSPAIDAGTPISGYDDRIHAADYTAEPIIVSTAVDADPDIGAWMYAVPVTCADLGGADCCTGSQTCPGTDLGASSDCADVCCSVMCAVDTCQDQGYQCCDACGSGAHPQYDGDCPGQVCCEACEACSDGTCNGSETCQSCPQDCPTGAGEVCCSGVIYTGDCCEDGDCHDGDLCNGEESCSAGACQAGTPLDCDDGDPCTDDRCVLATGCEHTPDTSEECADDEPKGSCGCDAIYRPGSSQGGFGAPGPGEAGLGLLLLFMLAFALHHRLSCRLVRKRDRAVKE